MIALYITLYLAIGLLIFAWRFRVAASELDLYTLKNCKKSASALLNEVVIFGMPGPIAPIFVTFGWPIVLVVRAVVLLVERCPNLLWLLIERDVTTRSIAADLTDAQKPAPQQPMQANGFTIPAAVLQQIRAQLAAQQAQQQQTNVQQIFGQQGYGSSSQP